jgi:hypothetical protein
MRDIETIAREDPRLMRALANLARVAVELRVQGKA